MRLVPGTTVQLGCEFSVDGVLTDPSTVECWVIYPSGAQERFSYVGGQVVRDGVGQYSMPIVVDTEGSWEWRWIGTGACAAVDQGFFVVRTSAFV